MGRTLVEGSLDQRDVHPAVELVRRIADGAYDLETLFRVERQPRPVVGRDAGDQGPVAEPSSLGGQLLEQGGSDPAAVVDGVDVHEALHDVKPALLPWKQPRPA